MKNPLLVLLLFAVTFFFLFGTAFADTKLYTGNDYVTALSAEMQKQIGYMNSERDQFVGSLKYNNLGYTKEDLSATVNPAVATLADDVVASGYHKEAVLAGAQYVIDQLTSAMSTAIADAANAVPAGGTATAPDFSTLSISVTIDGNTIPLADALDDANYATYCGYTTVKEVMDKAQYAAIEKTINAQITDLQNSIANYDDKDLTYKFAGTPMAITTPTDGTANLTAQAAIQAVIAETTSNIAAVDKTQAAADVVDDFEKVYSDFAGWIDQIKTIEADKEDNADKTANVIGETGKWMDEIKALYTANLTGWLNESGDTDVATALQQGGSYVYKAGTGKAVKVFGVEVKNKNSLTLSEVRAIKSAYVAAIEASRDMVRAFGEENGATAIQALYADAVAKFKTLNDVLAVADICEDIDTLGTTLKTTYTYGQKGYVDEKVDAAVAAAKEIAKASIGSIGAQGAEEFLAKGVNKAQALGNASLTYTQALGYLATEEEELVKLHNAITDAMQKMYANATYNTLNTATKTAIKYGVDKTPEEDLAYISATYDAASKNVDGDTWADIATDACKKLMAAESYADIDKIMADTKTAFSTLMLAKDASAVKAAQNYYNAALPEYAKSVKEWKGSAAAHADTYADAVKAGQDLVAAANTVDEVKAAYAKGQAIIEAAKTDAELKDLKTAIEKAIAALPTASTITTADKDTVLAAYNAYVEYLNVPGIYDEDAGTPAFIGTYGPINQSVLQSVVDAYMAAEKKAAADAIDATKKALDKLNGANDNDLAAIAALRADAEANIATVDDFNDLLEEMGAAVADSGAALTMTTTAITTANPSSYDTLDTALNAESGKIWMAEQRAVNVDIYKVVNDPNATTEELKAALEAFNKLTDRQQYYLSDSVLEKINVISNKMTAAVETLKITASSTAKKGSITVKWSVKGNADAATAYEIWKSTKKNSGFKKSFTTKDGTKRSYKNTKELKKGTRYYYKVRAIAYDVNGKKITSDWSNKAYRKAL